METKSFEAPALFGDHHVTEVRRILLELPGVDEVYASSAFQVIEVSFDPAKMKAEQIAARLEETGYLDEIPILTETGIPAYGREDGNFNYRETILYETVKKTISFAQHVQYQEPQHWLCPGLGDIKMNGK
jgi:copper chaperone CopZ